MAWPRPLYKPGADKTRARPYAYQGVAIHPSGRKATKVFKLKGLALSWAEEQEAAWRRDRNHDPRAGEIRFADWLTRWQESRRVGPETAKKDASTLKNHIKPQWGTWPLSSIDRLDVGAWIKTMERDGVGPNTIAAAVTHFHTILQGAVDLGLVPGNVAARQKVPRIPPVPAKFYTSAEAGLIVAEIAAPVWQLACDLDFATGLRLGELLGLRAGRVDWARAELTVAGVMTRSGWREYPKSKKSFRVVPIPDHLLDALAPHVVGRGADDIVFPAPAGGHLTDVNFRNRIWNPAVASAGLCKDHRPKKGEGIRDVGKRRAADAERQDEARKCKHCIPVPQESPHTMRHTAASWLVMAGVDLYRVQALLGHESFATTQRYAHLMPGAHDPIRAAWKNLGASTVQTDEEAPPPRGR